MDNEFVYKVAVSGLAVSSSGSTESKENSHLCFAKRMPSLPNLGHNASHLSMCI
jgi:hypothetical protein